MHAALSSPLVAGFAAERAAALSRCLFSAALPLPEVFLPVSSYVPPRLSNAARSISSRWRGAQLSSEVFSLRSPRVVGSVLFPMPSGSLLRPKSKSLSKSLYAASSLSTVIMPAARSLHVGHIRALSWPTTASNGSPHIRHFLIASIHAFPFLQQANSRIRFANSAIQVSVPSIFHKFARPLGIQQLWIGRLLLLQWRRSAKMPASSPVE